jgi:hypothetical protein
MPASFTPAIILQWPTTIRALITYHITLRPPPRDWSAFLLPLLSPFYPGTHLRKKRLTRPTCLSCIYQFPTLTFFFCLCPTISALKP